MEILSLSHSLRQETPEEITFEDAESLLYEASRKMESINGAVLLQSEFQPKTLKNKRFGYLISESFVLPQSQSIDTL